MPITILLADDATVMRETLRQMLARYPDLAVVAEAADGGQAVALAEAHQPDLAVVDIGMQPMNGIDAANRIRRCAPRTAVLMLTMHCNAQYVARSLGAGARGYLIKGSLEEAELVSAIREVSAGGSYFSPEAARMLPPTDPALASRA